MHTILLIALIALDLIPTWMAFRRNHPKRGQITILNVLLGWTVIGWVVAMVWALSGSGAAQVEYSN
jgi:hypothetical protein